MPTPRRSGIPHVHRAVAEAIGSLASVVARTDFEIASYTAATFFTPRPSRSRVQIACSMASSTRLVVAELWVDWVQRWYEASPSQSAAGRSGTTKSCSWELAVEHPEVQQPEE